MVKSSQEQIEIDEKKIIRELEKDSNQSIDQIAKKCGFSRQKVWRVIKRLENDNVIWGYHAISDDAKLGLSRYYLLLKRKSIGFSNDMIQKIIKREVKTKVEQLGVIIENLSYTHGSFDIVIELRAANIKHVLQVDEMIKRETKEYFLSSEILEVLFPIEIGEITNPNMHDIQLLLGIPKQVS